MRSLSEKFLYGGVFDDRITAFQSRTPTLKDYHNLLLQAFLTGRKLLLNDGYILQHPLILEDMKKKESLLFALADRGQIVVSSRSSTNYVPLSELPRQKNAPPSMKERYKKEKASGAWDDVRRGLDRLDRCSRASWPSFDKDVAFCRVMARFYSNVDRKNADRVATLFLKCWDAFHDYISRTGNYSFPRTTWECIVKGENPGPIHQTNNLFTPPLSQSDHADENAREHLMAIANMAYHYAFVACCRLDEAAAGVDDAEIAAPQTQAYSLSSPRLSSFSACLRPERESIGGAYDKLETFEIPIPQIFERFLREDGQTWSPKEWNVLRTFIDDEDWRQKRLDFSERLNDYNVSYNRKELAALDSARSELKARVETMLSKTDLSYRAHRALKYVLKSFSWRDAWKRIPWFVRIPVPFFVEQKIQSVLEKRASSYATSSIAPAIPNAIGLGMVCATTLGGIWWRYNESKITKISLTPDVLWVVGKPFDQISRALPKFAPNAAYGESVLFPTPQD